MALELTFDDILDDDFEDVEEIEQEDQGSGTPEEQETEEITEGLTFDDDLESVGDDEDTEEQEDADGSEGSGTSPVTFSSIAEALVEEGVFPDLEAEAKEVKTAADFVALVKKHTESQLDEAQKRINSALEVGMEPDAIKAYEGTIRSLEGITDEAINAETEEAETLRKRLIYNDYINRGFKKEKALAWTNKSIANGTDKEDAKDALESNLEYYKDQYSKKVSELKKADEENKALIKKQSEDLRKSILEDEKVFGSLSVDKNVRSKIYDNICKPVFKDKETGDVYTAIQKFEKDNPTDFLKYVGMFYTLTDGFKNIDALASGMAKKQVKSKMKTLEQKLNHTSRNSDGVLDFLGGLKDPESGSKGFQLDI